MKKLERLTLKEMSGVLLVLGDEEKYELKGGAGSYEAVVSYCLGELKNELTSFANTLTGYVSSAVNTVADVINENEKLIEHCAEHIIQDFLPAAAGALKAPLLNFDMPGSPWYDDDTKNICPTNCSNMGGTPDANAGNYAG